MDENKKPNPCISCTVKECAHHARTTDYCSLEKICVGTHEKNPTMTECTDCESFRLGTNTGSNTASNYSADSSDSNRGCTTCGETGAR